MDRKAIIAFIIIGLLIVLYPYYLRWISPPSPKTTPIESPDQKEEPVKTDQQTVSAPDSESGTEIRFPQQVTLKDTAQVFRDVVIDAELYRGVVSTRGGTIKSWQLKLFEGVDEKRVELVPEEATGALGVVLNTGAGHIDLSDNTFTCQAESLRLDRLHPSDSLKMVLTFQDGRRIEKEFIFRHDQYSFDFKLTLEGFGELVPTREYELTWSPGLRSTEANVREDMSKMAAFALMGGDAAKYDIGGKNRSLNRKEEGVTGWVSIRTKYFLMSMIPRSTPAKGLEIQGEKRKVNTAKGAIDVKVFGVALRMPLNVSTPTTHAYEIYLGPQDYSILRRYGAGLERCMDMGWAIIRPISRVILAFFVFVHGFIPNYGVVIIIFSLLLKVIFYPLTHKQLEATKKMQELQPQLAALKEKYKNDPQRLNRETMALYKKGGANPLGGCFPLLLQMPIFFALFSVFRSTIELRRAEFVWWIKDLSLKDPYLVLPIVMAVTMFVQQKMTVKDPKQAAMVYLMPAIMFFFFMNFASGLVLYWTVFNILSIIQQLVMNRSKGEIGQK